MITHGIDGIGILFPHDKVVKKGGPELVTTSPPPATKQPTSAQKMMFAKMGLAMPDGSYYIRNGAVGASDLQNAIDSVGRGESAGDSGAPIRKHIMKRADALKLSSKIPDTWNPDGSLKHSDLDTRVAEHLAHFSVKGMHWGVSRPRGSGSAHPVGNDAARASATQATIKKHGVAAVSNADLQHLVQRRGLEQQHQRLNPEHISAGKKVLDELLGVGSQVAKQQATTYASKYAAQGIEALVKKASEK